MDESTSKPILDQPKSSVRKKPSKILIILISLAIGLLLVIAGGIFVWQQIQKISSENSSLEMQITKMKQEKSDIEQKTCKGVWKNGICIQTTCIDSDINEKPNDIYIKGKVTYTDINGVSTSVYDECTGSKKQVNEMWCYESPQGSGNYVQGNMVYKCRKGCFDGACIQ